MARIRSIRPEFFTSETVAQLSVRARLTWIGLWTYCDDYGRGKDNIRLIHAALYPLDDSVTPSDVAADVNELEAAGRVRRYRAEGSAYLEVTNWSEHQKPNRRAESKIPAPSDGDYTPPPNGSQNGPGCVGSARALREQCADSAQNQPDDVDSGEKRHVSSVNGNSTAEAVLEQCGSRPGVVVGEGEGEGVGEGGGAAWVGESRPREAAEPPQHEPPSPSLPDPPPGPAVTGPSAGDAYRLVDRVIGREHPHTIRTALAIEAGQLLVADTDPELVTAALVLWLDKPNLGPRTLPSLVSEVIRIRTRPPAIDRRIATTDQRVLAGLALAERYRAAEERGDYGPLRSLPGGAA